MKSSSFFGVPDSVAVPLSVATDMSWAFVLVAVFSAMRIAARTPGFTEERAWFERPRNGPLQIAAVLSGLPVLLLGHADQTGRFGRILGERRWHKG